MPAQAPSSASDAVMSPRKNQLESAASPPPTIVGDKSTPQT